MTGRELGPYRVLEKLAQGGMGEVYRARDERLGRDVAVKLLPQEFLADPDRLRRFEQEARAAAALNHPNILSVYDIGTQDGVPYFVCELLKGETLRARLGRGPLTLKQVADYGAQLARGLAVAHDHGIVHRDIKPENLFITADGRLKILDFGIAKTTPVKASGDGPTATAVLLTEPGAIVGTVPYMSPEQVRGAPTDHRSDIFAAGAVLFEMLTGRRAFDAPSATEIMSAVLTRDPFADAEIVDLAREHLPPVLVQIVKHCLEKDPRERFQSARDIAFGLDVLSGSSDSAAKALIPARSRWRMWILAGVGAAAVIVLVLLVSRAGRAPGAQGMTDGGKPIATLPLANLSGNPQDDYFADGMTDSLITDLARTPSLAVIARAAVFRYKGKTIDPQKAGQELGARYVVHGSVQRAGEHVRVNVRLVDVVTGFDILGEPFEGEVKDLFALQDRISRQIVNALQLKLSPTSGGRGQRRPTTNEQAYDAYLQGTYYVHLPSRDGAEARANLTRAIESYEQAVSADPHFALAQAALGSAYSTRFFYFDPDRTWERQAFLAIERALAVDPDLAEAYLARGQNAWSLPNNFPHEKAVRDLQHAIAINPNLADAHRELGKIYMHIGLLDKSIEENSQALRLDPADVAAHTRRVLAYTYLRQCATAIQLLDQLALGSLSRGRAEAMRCAGRTDEALQLLAPDSTNPTISALIAALLARKGQRDTARKQVERLRLDAGNVAELSDMHHAHYFIGAAYALMGDTRQAVSWLKKASREGLPCYPLFERDPDLDSLRQDGEFAAFMAQLKAQHERFLTTF